MSNVKYYPLELQNKLKGFRFKKQPSIGIRRYLERVKKKKSAEEFDRYWNVKVSLVESVDAFCERVHKLNNGDYMVNVNVKKLILGYDGRMNNIMHCDLGGGNTFWQGILSLEPWCELKMEEESILELILHHHLFTNGEDVFFDFNKESPIDKFLRKHWDGDCIINIHSILRRVVRGAIEMLEKDDDQYPKYLEVVSSGYCRKCECSSFADDGKCFECRGVLEYS